MRAAPTAWIAALAATAAGAAAGCGAMRTSSEPPGSPQPVPTASETPVAATSATTTATATAPIARAKDAPSPPPDVPTTTSAPTPAGGESGPGGAGDEQAARVPVELTVKADGTVTPATVSVPAWLALELVVHNGTAGAISATMEGADPPGPLRVASGATGRRQLSGVRAGRYRVSVQGAGGATVIAGVEPGP